MESGAFKRWLAKQGTIFAPAKGSRFRVLLNGKMSIVPMHPSKEIGTGLVEKIKNLFTILRRD